MFWDYRASNGLGDIVHVLCCVMMPRFARLEGSAKGKYHTTYTVNQDAHLPRLETQGVVASISQISDGPMLSY